MSTTDSQAVEGSDKKDDGAHEVPYGLYRGASADYADPHRSWTNQSEDAFPYGEQALTTRFHPDELPDPDVIMQAGLMPISFAAGLVSADHETQPPSANIPLDHRLRAKNRGKTVEDGLHPNPQLEMALSNAKAQRDEAKSGSGEAPAALEPESADKGAETSKLPPAA
jgi:hypothetical protein